MMTSRKHFSSPSFYALILCVALLVLGKPLMSDMNFEAIIGKIAWDVFGYYLYLPATFIYGDPLLTDETWVRALFDTYQPSSTLYQVWSVREGTGLIKYSMGMAIMYLPGFLVGHFFAWVLGFPMDGMSAPYHVAITINSFAVVLAGLLLIRSVLLRFFSDRYTALGLILLFLGTNFFQISTNNTMTPHPYQFALFAWLIYAVVRWYESPQRKWLVHMALALGIAMLARPSSVVLVILIFLWGCANWRDVKSRWFWWWDEHRKDIFRMAGILLLIALPQMVYWWFATGRPIYYSYPSDGFDFLTPYTDKVLFSYRKGWWVYTPLMVLSFLGLWSLYKSRPKIGLTIAVFWVVNLYIISSWNTWWYGGSFGHRAFLDAYGIYLFPILAFVEWVHRRTRIGSAVLWLFIAGCCVLNVFQSWQMNHWILNDANMTKPYYWRIFGKTEVTPEDRLYLGAHRFPGAQFDRTKPYRMILDTTISGTDTNITRWGPGSISFEAPMYDVSTAEHTWWVIDASITPLQNGPYWLRIQTRHDNKNIKVSEVLIVEEITPDSVYSIHFEYLTPILKADRDYTRVYFSGEGKSTLKIDSLSIQVYEPTWYD